MPINFSNAQNTNIPITERQRKNPFVDPRRNTGDVVDAALAATVGAPVDLADSLLTTIGDITPFEFDRGDLSDRVRFLREHRGAGELGSAAFGVALAFTPVEAITGAAAFEKVLNAVPGASKVFGSLIQAERAQRRLSIVDQGIATVTGLGGVPALKASVTILSKPISREAFANASRLSAIRLGFTNNAIAEGIILGALNENDIVVPSSSAVTTIGAFTVLNIGVGTAFEVIARGAAVRRGLQGLTRARESALDPAGIDVARERISTSAFDAAGNIEKPRPVRLSSTGGGVNTANLSFKADQAALGGMQRRGRVNQAEILQPSNPQLANRLREESNTNLVGGATDLDVIALRGQPGLEDSDFRITRNAQPNNPFNVDPRIKRRGAVIGVPEAQTMLDIFKNSPEDLRGIMRLGRVPEGATIDEAAKTVRTALLMDRERAERRFDKLAKTLNKTPEAASEDVLAEDLQIKFRELTDLDNAVFVVFDNGGVFPLSAYTARGKGFQETAVEVVKSKTGDLPTFRSTSVKGLSVSTSGVELPVPLESLTFEVADNAYGLGRQFLDKLQKTNKPFVLKEGFNFIDADLAIQFKRENPEGVLKLPPGVTEDTIQTESFAQKMAALKARTFEPEDLPTLRRIYNLPSSTSAEIFDSLDSAEHILLSEITPDEIRKLTKSELEDLVQQVERKRNPASVNRASVKLSGDGFNAAIQRNADGIPTAPVLALRENVEGGILSLEGLEDRLSMQLANTIAELLQSKATTQVVSDATKELIANTDFRSIVNLSQLNDITRATSIFTTRIREGIASLQDFAAAGNTTILAAQRMNRLVSAIFDNDIDSFIRTAILSTSKKRANPITVEQAIGELLKPSNIGSRLLVEQFMASRPAFQLTGELQTVGVDKFAFVIKDNASNRVQYQAITGKKFAGKNTLLPRNDGEVLLVDSKALDALVGMNQITSKLLADKNAILLADGFREIRKEPFYIARSQLPFRAFIINPARRKVIRTLDAPTEEQLNAQIQVLRNDPKSILSRNPSFTTLTEFQLRATNDARLSAEIDFLDNTNPFVQSVAAKKPTGAVATPFVRQETLGSFIKGFRDISRNNAQQLLEAFYRPQLNQARLRKTLRVASTAPSSAPLKAGSVPIEEVFESALLGRKISLAPGSKVGQFFEGVDRGLDAGFASVFGFSKGFNSFGSRANFDEALAKISEFTPFEKGIEILEQQKLFSPPASFKDFAGPMNRLATALLLRYDQVHSIINMLGMLTTLPSAARGLIGRAGESGEELAFRAGRSVDVFRDLDTGKTMTIWSPYKEFINAIGDMLNPKSAPIWDRATRTGSLTAPISELHRDLANIRDQTTFKKLARKADEIVGFLSTNSEKLAVSMTYFTGRRLFTRLGVKDEALLDSLSRQLVDKTIGNFSPVNRPQIFQSEGLGSSLGLFQTYIINYYNRLFGFIENRQHGALAVQAATQAMFFGLNSVPGVSQASNLIFQATRGEQDPIQGLYNRFPTQLADGLLYGVPSILGAFFGVDDSDLPDFSTRGGTDPRLPGSFNNIPGLHVVATIGSGLVKGAELFRKDNPGITSQQVGELLQQHVINRSMQGLIASHWTKAIADPSGNFIAEASVSPLQVIWNSLGVKTVSQSEEARANRQSVAAEAMRRERRVTLSRGVKQALRGGEFNENIARRAIATFAETGGTPSELAEFFVTNNEAAHFSKTARRLQDQLSNPEKFEQRFGDIMRLFEGARSLNNPRDQQGSTEDQ